MAFPEPRGGSRARHELGDLVAPEMLWWAWLPVVLIGLGHYATGAHHHWVHDILRRLYYVPILFAAFRCGVRGGVLTQASVLKVSADGTRTIMSTWPFLSALTREAPAPTAAKRTSPSGFKLFCRSR